MNRDEFEFALSLVFEYGGCPNEVATLLKNGGYVTRQGDSLVLTPAGESALFEEEAMREAPEPAPLTDADVDAFFAGYQEG